MERKPSHREALTDAYTHLHHETARTYREKFFFLNSKI